MLKGKKRDTGKKEETRRNYSVSSENKMQAQPGMQWPRDWTSLRPLFLNHGPDVWICLHYTQVGLCDFGVCLVWFIWGRLLPPIATEERFVMENFFKKLNLLLYVGKPLMASGFRVLTDSWLLALVTLGSFLWKGVLASRHSNVTDSEWRLSQQYCVLSSLGWHTLKGCVAFSEFEGQGLSSTEDGGSLSIHPVGELSIIHESFRHCYCSLMLG